MNAKPRSLILLLLIPILLACRYFVSSINLSPTATLAVLTATSSSTFTPVPSFTSTPSPTFTPKPSFTPTPLPPSLTPTQVSTPSPTPTLLPLNIQLSIFENLWTTVNDTYVYSDFNGLDWNAIHQEYHQKIKAGLTNASFYLAMDELITRLGDDHSYFLDPQQVAQQDAEYQGKHDYVGIGIMVSAVPERQHAVILSVFPGSPAEAAGLQPRDSIISVDGTPILDENGYLRDIVRGPEGTSIDILAQTPGEKPREVNITRHRITGDYPIVYSVITTRESKRIGYIFLDTFMDGTVDEQVAHALQEMSADKPLDGLILDNRMNTGGSSAVLEPVLGYFIGGKLGSFIKRSDQNPLRVKLNDINGSSKLPLVVLVGSETASFGEIFAGILQDTGRAYVIGTTTNGNVEILWGYDFEDGSQLWLANETFRPLNHPEQDWEKTGIIPDLTISGDFDQYSLNNDPPVIAALKYLSDH
jgi:carboxyl-terminal processing protease